ncbi:MAG: hypothetical protein K2N63_01890 [Lachnospiraceae bacterium]|nr:hypothetical protein [Lachnospiraceae bacterium]
MAQYIYPVIFTPEAIPPDRACETPKSSFVGGITMLNPNASEYIKKGSYK